ncbi:hypothetical protein ACHAPT_002697 [Fusarium lateritium]
MEAANCGHVFCDKCLLPKANSDNPDKTCPYPGCSEQLAAGESQTTLSCINHHASFLNDFKEPGRDSNGTLMARKPRENSFFLATSHATSDMKDFEPIKFLPSAKLLVTMAVMLTWQIEAPEDKVIVFVEFLSTAKALGRILEMVRMNFLYYNGSVSAARKQATLNKFKVDENQKILLASMRCGGQSLNLTEANRVIIVDPWWNMTLENQAFGRVRRIRQAKETHLVRIMAEGSIDNRIFMLQEAKDKIVKHALQDDGHQPIISDELHLELLFSPRDDEEIAQELEERMEESKKKKKKKS